MRNTSTQNFLSSNLRKFVICEDHVKNIYRCTPQMQDALIDAFEKVGNETNPLKISKIFNENLPKAAIEIIHESLFNHGKAGFIVLTDLPESCAQQNTFTTCLTATCSTPVSYPGEGDITISIRPKKNSASNPSFQNSVEFNLHTDLSYVPIMPDVLVMVCKNPAADGRGESILSCVADMQQLFSNEIYHQLCKPQFTFAAPAHYQRSENESQEPVPVITHTEQGLRVRFRYDKISAESAEGKEAIEIFNIMAKLKAKRILLPRNSAVLVNQRFTLHGREEFTPTYNENDRELTRAYGSLCTHKFKHFDNETGKVHF